jgi:hypothetical protein
MVNFSINEYKDIIKYYKKTIPKTIYKVRNKAKKLLAYKMLETNITENKRLIMKMNRRGNKNKTLKRNV